MENQPAIEQDSTIASNTEVKVSSPTDVDLESRFAQLEAEKLKAVGEAANYKMAYLKEKSKQKEESFEDEEGDEKFRRIAREELANSRLAEIATEQDAIIKKALRENKELKLAQLNKTNTPPAAMGTHSEGTPVKDTLVTPEQLAYFKSKNYTEKDIERYKKNLQKYGGK